MSDQDKHLNIGAARAKIEIPDDFFPYRSFKGRFFTGQRDDIHVRCIILESNGDGALLISIELGDLGDIDMWLEKISRESGVPAGNIFITVTHNHEAPHVSDSYNQTVVDVEKTRLFGEYVWNATSDAIRTAKKNMKPGRMAYGTGSCDININRDLIINNRSVMGPNRHGISDKTVAVMKFEDLDGEPVAYFINYAVHGCIMFPSPVKGGGMLVTGDLPGETSRYIEQKHNDRVVALWTSGAAGDQNPRYMANRTTFDSNGNMVRQEDALEAGYLLVQVQAESLADEVLLVASNMKKTFSQLGIKGIHKKYIVPGQKKVKNPFQIPEDYVYEDGDPVNLHLSVLLIGNVALVGIPGEIVCSIGLKLKESLPYRNVVAVTHCNGSISYMSDEYGFENRTFEAVVSHVKRGCAEDAIINGASEMIDTVLGGAF